MILKGIKQEGRIRIYMITFVMYVFGSSAYKLPKAWMKFIAMFVLSFIYLYTTTTIGKKFRYNIHKNVRRLKHDRRRI